MKTYFLLFLAFGVSQLIKAQGSTQYYEENSVKQMLQQRLNDRNNKDYKLLGYKVFINLFSSRKEATDFVKEFNYRFEGYATCNIEYDEPNFKLYAGTYILQADAQKMLSRVKQAYPTSKIIRTEISTSQRK